MKSLQLSWKSDADEFHPHTSNFQMSMFINTLMLHQNGCHFVDNIFNCISLNGDVCIFIEISWNFVS